ncbi:MAG: SDR family NAD(P)-dependent oxidoreductase [Actinomycetota bacterium]
MTYDASTTTDQILEGLDLAGRHFVLTGASSGLGEETTRALADHGATVTMLARDPEKNAAAADRVRGAVAGADLRQAQVDLADLSSVRAVGDQLGDAPIDVLINNAGVMACPYGTTADGFEMQFGTNHLGHFVLTATLMPSILAGESPRVVTLSSAAHGRADVDLADPGFATTEYDPWISYGRSKSANALFARELARRSADTGLLSFAVHPGGIMTELGRHLTQEMIQEMLDGLDERSNEASGDDSGGGFEFKSVEAGAATQVWAATRTAAEHNGAYLADCRVGEVGVDVGTYGIEPHILDDATAADLWDLSEQMTGQTFSP